MQKITLLIHTVYGKYAIIAVAGQGCVSVLSTGNPGGGLYQTQALQPCVWHWDPTSFANRLFII